MIIFDKLSYMEDSNNLAVGIDGNYREVTVIAAADIQHSGSLIQFVNDFNLGDRRDFLYTIKPDTKILVLGSGEGKVVSDLRKYSSSLEIIDFNPAFVRNDFRKQYPDRKMDIVNKITLAGINPELPFKSDSLDMVIDDFSSVYVANDDLSKSSERIIEINRIIKEGGKAYIGPFKTKETFEDICTNLQTKGIKFEKLTNQYTGTEDKLVEEVYRLIVIK